VPCADEGVLGKKEVRKEGRKERKGKAGFCPSGLTCKPNQIDESLVYAKTRLEVQGNSTQLIQP
jgi:hypothetical protein